jgi:hypothetical protein
LPPLEPSAEEDEPQPDTATAVARAATASNRLMKVLIRILYLDRFLYRSYRD